MNNNNEYDFNKVSRELINSIQKIKQGKMLEKSFLTCKHSIPKEILEISDIDHDVMIREQLRQRLAQQIIGATEQNIKTENYHDSVVYSLEIMAFIPEDLKHIVEYCIKEMPLEAIFKIKGNNEQQ